MAHEFHCERFLKAFSVVNNHKAAVQFRFSSTISFYKKNKSQKIFLLLRSENFFYYQCFKGKLDCSMVIGWSAAMIGQIYCWNKYWRYFWTYLLKQACVRCPLSKRWGIPVRVVASFQTVSAMVFNWRSGLCSYVSQWTGKAGELMNVLPFCWFLGLYSHHHLTEIITLFEKYLKLI